VSEIQRATSSILDSDTACRRLHQLKAVKNRRAGELGLLIV
jgi:hypothetical protein